MGEIYGWIHARAAVSVFGSLGFVNDGFMTIDCREGAKSPGIASVISGGCPL